MRIRGISSIEEANVYLPTFIENLNLRFGVEAAEGEDAHRGLRGRDDLDVIFARHEERKLSKNLTFQYEGGIYLVDTKTPNRLRHAKVEISHSEGQPIQVGRGGDLAMQSAARCE